MKKRSRMQLVVTEEQSNDVRSYLDFLLNLIKVDETHEWMPANDFFDNIHSLYAKIDEVESVIAWADPKTPLTPDTRKQLFDLLDEWDYFSYFVMNKN